MKTLTYIIVAILITLALLIGFTLSILVRIKEQPKVDFPEELIPYITDNPKDTLDIKCYYNTKDKVVIFKFKDSI